MATHSPPGSFNLLSQQTADTPLRFPSPTFGKFLEQAREEAAVTREAAVDIINEIISKNNERLPSNKKVQMLNPRIYGNLERNERWPVFEELEPLYRALSELLAEPFSRPERERYVALAQGRFAQRKRRPKKGYTPTPQDWQDLLKSLASLDARKELHHTTQMGKVPYLLPVPPAVAPQIRLSAKVVSLLNFDTSYILERDSTVDRLIRLWDEGKRLTVIKAISGIGKTRLFYLLLKHIVKMHNRWPFYYLLSSGESQTPDDHLDTLLSLLAIDLHLSSPEEKPLSREDRMEQLFTELVRCSAQGLRLAVFVDDAHLLLDQTGTISASWQYFFDLFLSNNHAAMLYLATREWPHWRGRNRSFLKEMELEALSPLGGATLWKRFGFEDVPDSLLEEASRKCDGNPQLIELRASDLDQPGHRFLWPRTGKTTFTSQSADNHHTERIKAWLAQETIFDPLTDVGAREELVAVFTRQLPYEAQHLLDLLVLAPLGIPFPLLENEYEHPELALDELLRCSLIHRDGIEQGRVTLVSLAREARLHLLSKEQREAIERRVINLYTAWLYELQQYQDDAEQAALIAELVVLYSKQQHLLQAVELLVTYGWLCTQLGHIGRIARAIDLVPRSSSLQPEQEAGLTLLEYQITALTGKKVDAQARQVAYHKIYTAALQGTIHLQPHTEVMLAHFLMLPPLSARCYADAYQFLVEASNRIVQESVSPEVRAALLHSKAHVLGKWSNSAAIQEDAEHILRLREECVAVLSQAIDCWRSRLEHILPLRERYVKFRLARALNDFAYYSRLLGKLSDAQSAIRECIQLKRQGATLSSSLGISLGEYAQILAAQGKFEQSNALNEEALGIMNALIDKGNTSVIDDKGMLLAERAHVYLQQARLREAKVLFEQAHELLKNTSYRQNSRDDAAERVQRIASLLLPGRHYQLDQQWFTRFQEIASSDDVELLAQAGPFTLEEQREWDRLFEYRCEREVKLRMKQLVAASKERELAQSLAEQSIPRLWYPFIDADDIPSRIARFQALLSEIETQEQHVIVCRLYRDKITEELSLLRLFEAVAHQDTAGVQKWNELLYGKLGQEEMRIALGEFAKMLYRALKHPEAQPLSEQVLAQLKRWHIHPGDFIEEKEQQAPRPQGHRRELVQKSLSASSLQCALEEVLAEYRFDWDILPSPERDAMAVDKDRGAISLPTHTRYSLLQALELIAEEIELHVFRSEAGKRSPLALLQSGAKGYLATEEGLAIHYIQQAREAQGFGRKSYSWITTLAPGLAAGVIFPPMSFREVYTFLERAFLISHLLAGKQETFTEVKKAATHDALTRTTRTFRGVPDLDAAGVCNLKDRVYLQGYLDVSRELATVPLDRLLVGPISIEQLKDMAELHILEPAIQHRRLASSPEWLSRLAQLAE